MVHQLKEVRKEQKVHFDNLKEGQEKIIFQNESLYLQIEIKQSISTTEQKNNQTELIQMQTLLNHLLQLWEQSTAITDKAAQERTMKEAVSVGGKLKFMVPIIPFLVNYETEITYTANEPIKSWKDIYRAFIGK